MTTTVRRGELGGCPVPVLAAGALYLRDSALTAAGKPVCSRDSALTSPDRSTVYTKRLYGAGPLIPNQDTCPG